MAETAKGGIREYPCPDKKEARPHKRKHSYMGCLNIHLPEYLPINHCPDNTLLEVEKSGKERAG